MREISRYATCIGLRSLASFTENPSAISAARNLLRELPLDERSFDDTYAEHQIVFREFLPQLEEWCRGYRDRTEAVQRRYEALYGFLSLMLVTLEALAESDKKRNESRSIVQSSAFRYKKHECREICGRLLRDTAVQQAIQAIYTAESSYTIRSDTRADHRMDDWKELDFSSLAFHRHGTTSIIVRIRQNKELRALKLILFPFLRFNAITKETREYGVHYNPNIEKNGKSPAAPVAEGTESDDLELEQVDVNQSGVVQVLASSEQWILMKYIDGLTLAELMSYPGLIEAKLETLNNDDTGNRTFSEILRDRLKSYTDEEMAEAETSVESLDLLRLDALLRIDGELSKKFPTRNIAKKSRNPIRLAGKLKRRLIGRLRRQTKIHSDRDESVAWRWMFAMGNAIVVAMTDLSKLSMGGDDAVGAPQVHGDLTPSNIIVNNSRDLSVTLIDLGRNYFYTQSITGRGSSDSGFVAPEIREGNPADPLSDVYSLGQLLQYIGYRGLRPNERVFDGYYDRTSVVARFLEDLIQETPNQRLTVYSSAKGQAEGQADDGKVVTVKYKELGEIANAEIEAVIVADRDGHGLVGDNPREVIGDILHPWSRAISRQWKVYKQRQKTKRQRREGRLRGYTRWLFIWSTISAVSGALVLGSVIFWAFRDINWPYGPETFFLGQKAVTGGNTTIPVIDSWRVASYHLRDWSHNWPARVVGFTYILTCAKYYSGIFSGLMPLQGRRKGFAGWRSVAAESMIRLQTISAPVLVATSVFIQAAFWPIASAIGQVIAFFCNYFVWSFAAHSIRDARKEGVSTIGAETNPIAGLDAFGEWVPSSAFYAVMVMSIGWLIFLGVLHDIAMYAVGVAAINICLFYLIKFGKGGRDIRIGLARGFLAAERLRILDELPSREPERTPAVRKESPSLAVPAQREAQERQPGERVQ